MLEIRARLSHEEASAALERLGEDLTGPALLEPIAREMERVARSIAPVRTGRTVAGISARSGRSSDEAGRIFLQSSVPYAKYRHWGTRYVRRYPYLLIASGQVRRLDAEVGHQVRREGLD